MEAKTPKRRWFRFSLRTLFVTMTLATLASWWLARPTILAQEFAQAFATEDYPNSLGKYSFSWPMRGVASCVKSGIRKAINPSAGFTSPGC